MMSRKTMIRGHNLSSVGQLGASAWERAIEACDRCLTIMREKGVAREGEASALARNQGTPVYLCAANLVRARALGAREGVRAAGEVGVILAEAEQLVAETGAMIYLPEVHLERAEAARLAGDEVARHRELLEAHRLFTALGATRRAERVARELGAGGAPHRISTT